MTQLQFSSLMLQNCYDHPSCLKLAWIMREWKDGDRGVAMMGSCWSLVVWLRGGARIQCLGAISWNFIIVSYYYHLPFIIHILKDMYKKFLIVLFKVKSLLSERWKYNFTHASAHHMHSNWHNWGIWLNLLTTTNAMMKLEKVE